MDYIKAANIKMYKNVPISVLKLVYQFGEPNIYKYLLNAMYFKIFSCWKYKTCLFHKIFTNGTENIY